MSYYRFQEIKPNEKDWERIESAYDSTCFQTRKWMAYLDRIHYKPFVAEVFSDDENIGYFLGEKLWRACYLGDGPIRGNRNLYARAILDKNGFERGSC